MSNLFELSEDNQRKEIDKLYWKKDLSIGQIAEMFETYPNKILRLMRKLGVERKTKSAAQKNSLKQGNRPHPTEGKERTLAEKKKIGKTVTDNWSNISDEERERRAQMSKDQWDKRENLEEMRAASIKAIKETSKHGSKLEKFIFDGLVKAGYTVDYHKEHLIQNEKMHLDLLIRNLGVVVEIDGPSHFSPIWGEEALARTQNADNRKNKQVTGLGLYMIRLRQEKEVSLTYCGELLDKLLKLIKKIERNSYTNKRLFTI